MVLLKCQTLQLSIKGVETFHRGSKYGNFWSPVFLIRRKTASKTQRHFMAIILKNSGFGGKGAFRAPNAQRFRTQNLAGKSKIGNIGDTEVKRKKYLKKP